ncbi:Flp pilus assembly complex ATPase component TadA [Candidatus Woesearchaeota archaeon]|nr:Flp pilus assembly complex ATPase component TadA [Candidatus Woesearchaeota archaeon]
MIYNEHTIALVDCADCPYEGSVLTSSPRLSKECKECPLITTEYDRLRIKTRLFTKEYDKNGQLLSVEPFFIDVRFGSLMGNLKLLDTYMIKTGAQVSIYEKDEGVSYLYFINIPEMNVKFNELSGLYDEVEEFKETGKTENPIIKRWYLDYGILEHLLFDDKVLEININPPGYKTAIRIVHADFDECVSNIFSSDESLEYLNMRLKISTGRPLNRAQPQLDGEIVIQEQKARVCAIIDPFSIFGTAYSIRKHRENPWTLPLFMTKKSINEWFAGLMSLAIAQGRSFLVAGPRGSGKTALLGSLLLELLPKYRMITIEDTQELPIDAYKSLGYDVLPLKVRSALSDAGMEIPFEKGLRTSLRLGDSCLIIGEIRSKEAKILYEAMRVGAMANVVAGTIHGDSPYGVFDRVVNDLGVPPGSFKVTDLIIIVNQIKLPGGLKRVRRVLSVTEVLKNWKDEPEFQDLLVWDSQKDTLVPTDNLLNGKSILLQTVLKVSKGYKDYNDIIREIRLRGWAKQMHATYAAKSDFLEAKYVSPINIKFTKLFQDILPLESEDKMKQFMDLFSKSILPMIESRRTPDQDDYVRTFSRDMPENIQDLQSNPIPSSTVISNSNPAVMMNQTINNVNKPLEQEPLEQLKSMGKIDYSDAIDDLRQMAGKDK